MRPIESRDNQTKVQEVDGNGVLSLLGSAHMPLWLIRQVEKIWKFLKRQQLTFPKRTRNLWRKWAKTKLMSKLNPKRSLAEPCTCHFGWLKRWLLGESWWNKHIIQTLEIRPPHIIHKKNNHLIPPSNNYNEHQEKSAATKVISGENLRKGEKKFCSWQNTMFCWGKFRLVINQIK